MLLINAVNAAGRPVELFVKDGKIAAVGQDLSALAGEGETVLDAGGLTVLPAFVDLHCHWRTPGFEYKEDIATGSMAAAAGGYTFVNLMPNTKPICSSAAQAAMVEQEAAEVGLCDVNQTVSITENFDGKSIDHLKTLPASVKFITEDGHGVQDNATMARAFAICAQKDITVMSHAEDMEISPWDYRLAEDIETVRNCWLMREHRTNLHRHPFPSGTAAEKMRDPRSDHHQRNECQRYFFPFFLSHFEYQCHPLQAQAAETLIHPDNCQTGHRKNREQITIILLTKIRNCQQPSSENRVDDSHADAY